MSHRIENTLKSSLVDAHGKKIVSRADFDLNLNIEDIRTVRVYLLEMDLDQRDLDLLAHGPFSDPVIQEVSVDNPMALKIREQSGFKWDWLIEVGFRPGVTDNEAKTAREAVELQLGRTLKDNEGVYTAVQYLVKGTLESGQVEKLARGMLANDLIQRTIIVPLSDFDRSWKEEGSAFFLVPKVVDETVANVEEIKLSGMSDRTLTDLSRNRTLALNLVEMKKLQNYISDPAVVKSRKQAGAPVNFTDVELEALAQTWSEHCKHKIFNALISYQDRDSGKTEIIESLFDTFIRQGTADIRAARGDEDWCLSVFKDNAGVIRFNNKSNIAFKVETHNSPSALDPYGGALTGIVGVNRDPFGTGLGSKLIFNTNIFCFGPPDYNGELPAGLLHPKRIFEGVREGVEHGGNQSGIPTVNGSILFDERYLGKPLVFCGTAGIMPSEVNGRPGHEKKAEPGDYIVMSGGRIGKDGIHGATFSSEELHEGSPVTAVQIGDPITQKKMTDFLLRARDAGLYNSITDNGAGGLSSSVGEMAEEAGGMELHLEMAPLKYHGLQPWEILVSEAQERMTIAVPPEKIDAFMALSEKMGVESTKVGRFTDTGFFHCLHNGKTVAWLEMEFLHNGVPRLELEAVWERPVWDDPVFEEPGDYGVELEKILGRFNVCSKEYVVRQYDHEVQGGSVVKPLTGAENDGPSDSAVIRPDLESFEGLVVAHGICPEYSDLDAYNMAACAVDEAVRNAISSGADINHMAGLDNFCWCDPVQSEKTPDGHYKLAQLVRANKALFDVCKAYGVPCISGKDSMKNDANIGGSKISIPPTLLFSVVAKISDVRKAVTIDAKVAGDQVYVLGTTFDELGGSEYFASKGIKGGKVPKVRHEDAFARYNRLSFAIEQGLVASCHDCSDGGLGVALAETAFSGKLGMRINLDKVPSEGVERCDTLLFSETQSRFVVTVKPDNIEKFEETMNGTVYARIGEVTQNKELLFISKGEEVLRRDIQELKHAWKEPLSW